MQESPFYQLVVQHGIERGIERGIEQGARENAIDSILAVLTERFPQNDTDTVKPSLEAISDLEHLKELHLSAVRASSFQAFLQTLEC